MTTEFQYYVSFIPDDTDSPPHIIFFVPFVHYPLSTIRAITTYGDATVVYTGHFDFENGSNFFVTSDNFLDGQIPSSIIFEPNISFGMNWFFSP